MIKRDLETEIRKSFENEELTTSVKSMLYSMMLEVADVFIKRYGALEKERPSMVTASILAIDRNWNKVNAEDETALYFMNTIGSAIYEKYKDLITEIEKSRILERRNTVSPIKNDATPEQIDQWKPVFESYGITDPDKVRWLTKYSINHLRIEEENRTLGEKAVSDDAAQLLEAVGYKTKPEETTTVITEVIDVTEKKHATLIQKLKKLWNKIINSI